MFEKKVLLHICCAGCGAYVSQVLEAEGFHVTLFYFNPGIFPKAEFLKRKKEVERIAKKFDLDFVLGKYDHVAWQKKVSGLEAEPEKGRRCLICYQDRLAETALKAREMELGCFASTLSVSPYKLADEINRIGEELSEKYEIPFLVRDFKKKDGFKKAAFLSCELDLYRQNFCGCEFSQS